MGYNKQFGCCYPTSSEQHKHMRLRQNQNLAGSYQNPAENWFNVILLRYSNHSWTRQSIWGTRLFDFWCHKIGVAIEIDGQMHDSTYDSRHDNYNYFKSGIQVVRLKPFNNESAIQAIKQINSSISWNERRSLLGLKPVKT